MVFLGAHVRRVSRLAQAKGGLYLLFSCRVFNRWQRERAAATSIERQARQPLERVERVEFEAAYARRCGGEGDGIKTIIGMVALTRLDCVTGALGICARRLCRRFITHATAPLSEKTHRSTLDAFCSRRSRFGARGSHGARLSSRKGVRQSGHPEESLFARIAHTRRKLYVCKTVPGFVYETLECLGGNGYVEEGPLARLYREAPLNAIWEGSGNIMALDLLRGVAREPEGAERVLTKLAGEAAGLRA